MDPEPKAENYWSRLQSYATDSTIRYPIVAPGPYDRYSNKVGIDLGKIGDFEKNTVCQEILSKVGSAWIEFIKQQKEKFWYSLMFKVNEFNELMVKVVIKGEALPADAFHFDDLVQNIDQKLGVKHLSIYIQWTPSRKMPPKGTNVALIFGSEYIVEKILGIDFYTDFDTFCQCNPFATPLIYQKLGQMIKPNANDEFIVYGQNAGHICFTSGFNSKAYVSCPFNARALRHTMDRNKISHVELILDEICAKLSAKLDEIQSCILVVSPGGAGLRPNLVQSIKRNRHKIRNLYHVSCKIHTLEADLKAIGGCHLEQVQFIDAFPGTKMCETIAKISVLSEEGKTDIKSISRDIKSSRDIKYISLGSTCGIAYQLDTMGLKTETLPFDWLKTEHLASITEAIKTKSFGMASDLKFCFDSPKHPVLEDGWSDSNGKSCVYQNLSGIRFYHDFPKVFSDENDEVYVNFRTKYERRFDRLYELFSSGSHLVFIRDEHKAHRVQILELEDLVRWLRSKLTNGTKMTFILVVNNPLNKKFDWEESLFKHNIRLFNDTQKMVGWKRENLLKKILI